MSPLRHGVIVFSVGRNLGVIPRKINYRSAYSGLDKLRQCEKERGRVSEKDGVCEREIGTISERRERESERGAVKKTVGWRRVEKERKKRDS